MEESENKSDFQKRRCGKCWKLPPDLLIASVVQTVHDNTVQQIFPRLVQKQAEDQAGFRSSYQRTDHLATYRMIEQKCHEWGTKMWTVTIDITKAFDSITHKSMWTALESCSIEHDYISLLKKLFRDQKASALTDAESNMFEHWKTTFRAGKRKKEWEFT